MRESKLKERQRQEQELLVQRLQVKLDPLELRERLSRASRRVPPERSERLEQLELLGLPVKPDKLLVERLSLVLHQLELPQLRPESEVSEPEQSQGVQVERPFPEPPLQPAEHSELPEQEQPGNLDRPQILLQLDNSVRTQILQRPEQPDKR